MGIKHHRDLEAWRVADQIRRIFIEVTSRDVVKRDFDFCNQTNSAARSACRNLAEGFYRYSHADFARFVVIARSSLGELLDSVDEAEAKGYCDRKQALEWNALIAPRSISPAASTAT